jgi:tRNA modification GTPase
LFNLFLKEERSIVTEKPGTTRDWVEAWLNLDGIPLQLIDTAGLRSGTEDPIEAEGMRRTRELLAGSDLILAVADGTAGGEAAGELERTELALLRENEDRLIRVWNKADISPVPPGGWIPVSALSGEGFSDLEQAIRNRALAGGAPPEGDAPVIDSARQKAHLETAVAALDRFLEGFSSISARASSPGEGGFTPVDLLAEDLHEALDALGELTGAVTRTDVLNSLFSEFCVGK